QLCAEGFRDLVADHDEADAGVPDELLDLPERFVRRGHVLAADAGEYEAGHEGLAPHGYNFHRVSPRRRPTTSSMAFAFLLEMDASKLLNDDSPFFLIDSASPSPSALALASLSDTCCWAFEIAADLADSTKPTASLTI